MVCGMKMFLFIHLQNILYINNDLPHFTNTLQQMFIWREIVFLKQESMPIALLSSVFWVEGLG